MQSQFIEQIITISERYRIAIRSAINASELGISAMHVRSLSVIAKSPNCTANVIVGELARDKAQIARIVKELVSANLIQKYAHADDKRSQILRLTENGHILMEKLHTAKAKINQQITHGLTPTQLRQFEETAGHIADNLQPKVND
ncbi:MarR family winged helix-turn-helix transcriptional regulator [Paraglaciecola sp. 20A4]|uniref:MarR family winged helix-turn-helix transcriptional regulator n=1 Tax=Paraglaciecola sp. 20A4 TaxID=2687288 RepID=UPI00140DE35B|nr:MarR family winged helix-turn-helix transcriptional regulator [Paraglaciecola sp. 20A4]